MEGGIERRGHTEKTTKPYLGRAVLFIPGGGRVDVETGSATLHQGAEVTFGVRPQHITVGAGSKSICATVRMVEALGSETVVHGEIASQKLLIVAPGRPQFTPGSEIDLSLDTAPIHLFDEKGLRFDSTV